jgi:hypothetical protein
MQEYNPTPKQQAQGFVAALLLHVNTIRFLLLYPLG